MKWQHVSDKWAALVEDIAARWPRADADDLLAIGGEREAFEAYISQVHDLTRAEVREDVELWLAGDMPADVAMSERRDNANIAASAAHIPAGEDVYSEDGDFGDDRVPERPIGRAGDD